MVWVVSAVSDCAISVSPAVRSLHGRPGCSGSTELPTSCSSLSLSPFADDEAYVYHHGDASSTSPSASRRPNRPNSRFLAWVMTSNPGLTLFFRPKHRGLFEAGPGCSGSIQSTDLLSPPAPLTGYVERIPYLVFPTRLARVRPLKQKGELIVAYKSKLLRNRYPEFACGSLHGWWP